jgi:hypothetical protein
VSKLTTSSAILLIAMALPLASCGGSSRDAPPPIVPEPAATAPEYYGLFAVAPDGSLQRLDGDRDWEISTWTQRSNFGTDVSFVVYDRPVATAGQPLSEMIHLYRVQGVRNEIRADGTVRSATDNRWATVERDELRVPLDFAPFRGQPDAVRAIPRGQLEPGLYSLQFRSGESRKSARVGVGWSGLDHESYAAAHCVDRIHGERTQFRLCAEEPVSTGLRINLSTPRRADTFAGSTLIIEGVVTNVSDQSRAVPPIVGTIADDRGTPIRNWTFDSRAGELAPGESQRFREVVENPPSTPLRVNLSFADAVAAR